MDNTLSKQYADLLAAKKKVRALRIIAFFAALCIVAGVSLYFAGSIQKRNTYDNLVNISSATPLTEKEAAYEEAISLYPGNPEAYIRLLEAYTDADAFGPAESSRFLSAYNANRLALQKDNPDYAKLNFTAGVMFLSSYRKEGTTVSFSERVGKAYSFFESNETEYTGGAYPEESASRCLYLVCSFYKNYIFSATVKEISDSDMLELCTSAETAITETDRLEPYHQLTVYQAILNLFYDQRSNFAAAGVEKMRILDLMHEIHTSAEAMQLKNEFLQRLQTEIIENEERFAAEIEKAYSIAEKGG